MMIVCQKTDEWWKASLVEDGEIVSILTLKPHNDNCMVVHQEVFKWSPKIYKAFKEAFKLIQEGVKAQAKTHLITICESKDDWVKKQKYWKMMGFTMFPTVKVGNMEFKGAGLVL